MPVRAYITNNAAITVSVIDTTTNTVVDTITVGGAPIGVAVNGPITTRVYIANDGSGTVSVIDANTDIVIATIPIGSNSAAVAVMPNSTKVYVSRSRFAGTVTVIDAVTNMVTSVIPVGQFPFGLVVTPDNSTLYVANDNGVVSVIDTTTDTVITTVPVGANAEAVAVDPNGLFVYVTNFGDNTVSVIDTASNTVVATIPVGNGPLGVNVNPNGLFVYVTNTADGTVSVIDTSTNTVVATITVGTNPRGVSTTPDGLFTYVNNLNDNTVSVINTTTNTVVATVLVGIHPYSLGLFIGTVVIAPPLTSDLAVVKLASTHTPTFGSTITFTVTATNNGPDADTGVIVTDVLPSGYSYVSATPTSGLVTTQPIVGGFGPIIWTIGAMGAGASFVLTIVATVNPSGVYNNTATITGDNFDPILSNNTSTVLITAMCPTITVLPTTLPNGTVGVMYPTTVITASGGTGPYVFSTNIAQLPPGLNLSLFGTFSGIPTLAGTYTFTITATDVNNCTGSRIYTIIIGTTPVPTTKKKRKRKGAIAPTFCVNRYDKFGKQIFCPEKVNMFGATYIKISTNSTQCCYKMAQ